ncbi:MAG: tetratricopeptide repeat protein [Candidatus Handelsmanbacteria bacterium]|nr:tetratricopeptide repeat protein [Candidatus Handelsmanbacteria bacterium]
MGWTRTILPALLLLCAACSRGPSPEAQAAFEQGTGLHQQGRFPEAEAAYRRAVELAPEEARFHYQLAVALHAQGRFQDAEAPLQRAAELDRSYLPPRIALGKIAYDLKGDAALARKHLQEALDLDPRSAEALYTLGVIEQREGNFPSAVERFALIDSSASAYPQAQAQIGQCYLQSGQLDQAVEALKKAIRLAPQEPGPFIALGQVLSRQGKTREGQLLLARAEQLKQQFAQLQPYLEALRRNPSLAPPHYNLGAVYARFGQMRPAEEHYQQALALDSSYALAYQGLGSLAQRQGDQTRALDYYQRALAKDPSLAEAHNNMGLIYHQQGKLEEAAREYQAAVQLSPDKGFIYVNLGNLYKDQKQLDLAYQTLRQAISMDSTLTGGMELLGDVLALQGKVKEAIAVWEPLVRRQREHRELAQKLQRARDLLASEGR